MKRLGIIALWLLLPVAAGLWLTLGVPVFEPELPAEPDAARAPRYSLKGVQWTRLNAEGVREFTATADSADYFDDESAHYDQLQVDVVGIGKTPWTLSSPSGLAPPHERRISMQGPVVAEGAWPDGEPVTLRMQQLWVDPAKQQLQTEEGVAFESASRNGRSKGLQADWAKQTVQLLGDVRMQYVSKSP